MRHKALAVSKLRVFNRLALYGMRAPEGLAALPVSALIKIMRHGLGMTQAQLAKRAGLAQSHIARIETGRVDLQLSTLGKIFQALRCSPILVPRFEEKPAVIIAQRARETAARKVARISGGMALEKQLPEKSAIEELIHLEEERLRNGPSSEIWE